MESLSKKFFPEIYERHKLDEITIEQEQKLLKTIRNSRNLLSLTERLPKSKYHGAHSALQATYESEQITSNL